MQPGQRLRRGLDGQVGFLVIDEAGKKRVRLDRGTKLGTDQSTVPYSEHVWVPDEAPKITKDQIRRVFYAAVRELRIVRGEYSVKQWIDLRDEDRIGWKLSEQLRADLLALLAEAK